MNFLGIKVKTPIRFFFLGSRDFSGLFFFSFLLIFITHHDLDIQGKG